MLKTKLIYDAEDKAIWKILQIATDTTMKISNTTIKLLQNTLLENATQSIDKNVSVKQCFVKAGKPLTSLILEEYFSFITTIEQTHGKLTHAYISQIFQSFPGTAVSDAKLIVKIAAFPDTKLKHLWYLQMMRRKCLVSCTKKNWRSFRKSLWNAHWMKRSTNKAVVSPHTQNTWNWNTNNTTCTSHFLRCY